MRQVGCGILDRFQGSNRKTDQSMNFGRGATHSAMTLVPWLIRPVHGILEGTSLLRRCQETRQALAFTCLGFNLIHPR